MPKALSTIPSIAKLKQRNTITLVHSKPKILIFMCQNMRQTSVTKAEPSVTIKLLQDQQTNKQTKNSDRQQQTLTPPSGDQQALPSALPEATSIYACAHTHPSLQSTILEENTG